MRTGKYCFTKKALMRGMSKRRPTHVWHTIEWR